MHDLSLADARALLLTAQGLDLAGAKRATKDGVRAAIRRMGVLQIDTIHVVARSPYLVLWSRLGAYDPVWLDELLAEGRIFEYWVHEASFLRSKTIPSSAAARRHGSAAERSTTSIPQRRVSGHIESKV